MKLHDLHPAPGSRKARRRVGRGIAAGQGKTAGRGTKGQKARAGGSIPAWFEGGQTPLHQRIPKLRGFKNLFKIHYEVVNIGDIARLVAAGELESGEHPDAKSSKKGTPAPTTINQEILRAVGLVRRLDRPMKVLGGGGPGAVELTTALFVVADAFSASARSKIEAAGGTVSVLEVPDVKRPALRSDGEPAAPTPKAVRDAQGRAARVAQAEAAEDDRAAGEAAKQPKATAEPVATGEVETVAPDATESEAVASETSQATEAAPKKAAKAARAAKASAAAADGDATETVGADDDTAAADDSATADEAASARPRAARKPRASKPATDE
jgi:large subunit ribosomal protein L15